MKLTLYKARDGWRWRVKARNGRIVAESGEAYRRPGECLRGWKRLAAASVKLPKS